MSKILELFGYSTKLPNNWQFIVQQQQCPFLGKKCYKVRKSDPHISIGTCTVLHGKDKNPIAICPTRLIEKHQVFTDCFHLLTMHEPGNQLHIVPEIAIPGGNVDYFLVSENNKKVKDFVGIELQTLDTTGTVWPERQRVLDELGIKQNDNEKNSKKTFGMNWKMTAKTILVQMHHKIQTFEYVNKKLVLVLQDKLLNYMEQEFDFAHLTSPASVGDSMHFHAYSINEQPDLSYNLSMENRWSTDVDGISTCLGLHTEAKVELQQIIQKLESKLSSSTLFTPV